MFGGGSIKEAKTGIPTPQDGCIEGRVMVEGEVVAEQLKTNPIKVVLPYGLILGAVGFFGSSMEVN